MNELERQSSIEQIKQAKARYFRGVDTGDTQLVQGILAEDCVLDYNGCFTDPATGEDMFPAMNVVVRGRNAWSSEGLKKAGIVSVHQGFNFDISFTSDTTADVICAMTDRVFMPEGTSLPALIGHGYYHETYEHDGDGWKLKTLRIERLRVAAE